MTPSGQERTFSAMPRCRVQRAPTALFAVAVAAFASFTDGGPSISACSADSPARETNRTFGYRKGMLVSPSRLECTRRADDLIGLRGLGAPLWPRGGWNAGWPPLSPLMWRVTRVRLGRMGSVILQRLKAIDAELLDSMRNVGWSRDRATAPCGTWQCGAHSPLGAPRAEGHNSSMM